jgi:AcrR family transcriptional regulator
MTKRAQPVPKHKWRTPQGVSTHRAILRSAIELATVEGLAGLTLGRLAAALEMSKSGLFAHFGSKEELQLATIDAAAEEFFDAVVRPAMEIEAGLARLIALCEGWLRFAAEGTAPTKGCFFASVTMEFNHRPGQLRDRIARVMRTWLAAVESAIVVARDLGQLDPGVDAKQLAYELNALELGANWSRTVLGDAGAAPRARSAMMERIAAVTVKHKRGKRRLGVI